jgi:di/tricarboxylate transporter
VPFAPKSWPAAIDWHTIITLSGLMLLTKGVELSGYFDVLGRKMVRRFATERRLAMFMVLAAALIVWKLTVGRRRYRYGRSVPRRRGGGYRGRRRH